MAKSLEKTLDKLGCSDKKNDVYWYLEGAESFISQHGGKFLFDGELLNQAFEYADCDIRVPERGTLYSLE